MRFLQALRNEAAKVTANIEQSKLFTHMGDRGAFREAIIKDFLRPFLPECYGLSSGEVFSYDGEQSAQVDIVVYDAVFSTVLFKGGPCQLFPAESVYGSIEVKSSLSTEELDKAISNIASLKRLRRDSSDMLQFLPQLHFNVSDSFSYDKRPANPYVGFIFGYKGVHSEVVAKNLTGKLRENPAQKQLLPDFVFVADPGSIVLRSADCGVASPGHEFDSFVCLEIPGEALPMFFVTLNAVLGMIRLKGIDFARVWQTYFRELHQQAIAVAERPRSA